MAFSFSDDDIARIGSVLGVTPKQDSGVVRFELQDEASGRRVVLEVHRQLRAPASAEDAPEVLISVYASSSFLQLQGCTGFIASQELGEVIFFARRGGATSGLVVEREVGSSLYANVEDHLLSADFTQLPPELIPSSVALSMTESLFDNMS